MLPGTVSCYHGGPTGKHCSDDSRTQINPTVKHIIDILRSLKQPLTLTRCLVPLTRVEHDRCLNKGIVFCSYISTSFFHYHYFSFDSEFTPEETCWHSEVFCQMKTGKGVCKRPEKKQRLLWHFSCFQFIRCLWYFCADATCFRAHKLRWCLNLSLSVPLAFRPQILLHCGSARQRPRKTLNRFPLCCSLLLKIYLM